jgi:thiamine pyrophosphokinase
MLLQYKKQIKSTRFPEAKLGTYTITQFKRDLRNQNLRKSTSLSSKRCRFLSLQMLHIKRAGITFPITSSHDTDLTSEKINKSQTKGQMGSSWHLKWPVEEAHTSFVEVNTNGLIRDFL